MEDAWRLTVSELQASRIVSAVRPQLEGKEDSDDSCSDAMDELSLSELAFWMEYDDLEASHSITGEISMTTDFLSNAESNCTELLADLCCHDPSVSDKSTPTIALLPQMRANQKPEHKFVDWDDDFSDLRKELRSLAIDALKKTKESESDQNDFAGFTPGCR